MPLPAPPDSKEMSAHQLLGHVAAAKASISVDCSWCKAAKVQTRQVIFQRIIMQASRSGRTSVNGLEVKDVVCGGGRARQRRHRGGRRHIAGEVEGLGLRSTSYPVPSAPTTQFNACAQLVFGMTSDWCSGWAHRFVRANSTLICQSARGSWRGAAHQRVSLCCGRRRQL